MNKKGDISILLLVLMVLLLSASVLYIFAKYSGKAEAIVADARFVENSIVKEEDIYFYAENAAENALAEIYFNALLEISKGNSFLENEIRNSLKDRFKSNFVRTESRDEKFIEMKNKINNDEFNFQNTANSMEINLPEISLSGTLAIRDKKRVFLWDVIPTPTTYEELKAHIGVIYRPSIHINISLKEIGLYSFDEVILAKTQCVNEEESKKCMEEKINGFNALKKETAETSFELTSKRLYFIERKLRPIVIVV